MRYLNIGECEGEGRSKPSTAGKRWRSARGWVYRVFAKALPLTFSPTLFNTLILRSKLLGLTT